MNITEKQKQQLIDLNDSRVNEILNLGLKVGKWYKDLNQKGLYYIIEIKEDRFYFLGFDVDGNWEINDWYLTNNCVLSEATYEEIEQALVNEAKKRGFLTRGTCFKSIFSDRGLKRYVEPYKNGSDINLYLDNEGFLRYKDGISIVDRGCSNPVIFKDGIWSEIIDEKAELKQEIKELRNKLKNLEEKL